jgi:NAD(P)-dependent dehydrogenase (short-subunit alcohol dehydrogenase family)
MHAFSLEGKVALVTGASGLLGRQHCAALAEAGAQVIAVDLEPSPVAPEGTTAPVQPTLSLNADITDVAAIAKVRDIVEQRFGRLDVLVNNAAIDDKYRPSNGGLSRFEDYPVAQFRKQLDVNVTGTFVCCQQLGGWMAERGAGSIINIASTYGVTAPQQDLYRDVTGRQLFYKGAAYPTSKAAVIQLSRYLATYWGERGVRVNSLSPGGVFTEQDEHFVRLYAQRTPLRRMASPGDYRGAIVFLASDASTYMTGANLVVDGGWTSW